MPLRLHRRDPHKQQQAVSDESTVVVQPFHLPSQLPSQYQCLMFTLWHPVLPPSQPSLPASPCVLCVQQLGHLNGLTISRHGVAHAQQEAAVHAVHQVGAKRKHVAEAAQGSKLNACNSSSTRAPHSVFWGVQVGSVGVGTRGVSLPRSPFCCRRQTNAVTHLPDPQLLLEVVVLTRVCDGECDVDLVSRHVSWVPGNGPPGSRCTREGTVALKLSLCERSTETQTPHGPRHTHMSRHSVSAA